MSNIDSNTLADAIRNFVRQQNGFVSFVELSRQLPGIDGDFGLFPDGDGKRAKRSKASKQERQTDTSNRMEMMERASIQDHRESHAQRQGATGGES